jgi:uncharacterized membrane protein YbhN (UPF0104 family)
VSKILRLTVSAALLGWLAWQTDWPRVGAAFAGLRLEWWLVAAALLVVAQIVSALRWQLLARPLGLDRPLPHMVGYYFIGMYFNLLLPTSVGGDVVRAWYLAGGPGQRLRAFLTVFLDRLSGLWVLLVLACLGVLLSPLELPAWIAWGVWSCAAAGLVGSLLLPLLARYHDRVPGKVQRLALALRSFPGARVLVWPIVLSVFVQVASVVMVWLIGEALGAPVPASYYWVLVPMVSLLTLLPVSVNGMGVREGATAVLLGPLGIATETAVTLAFLWFAVSAAVSLVGGVVYLCGRFERPVIPAPSEEERSNGPVRDNPDQGREGQSAAAA